MPKKSVPKRKVMARKEVPLRMFVGNMNVLLNNQVPCTHISLKWDENSQEAVILMITATPEQKEIHDELGFTTSRAADELGEDE